VEQTVQPTWAVAAEVLDIYRVAAAQAVQAS